MVEKCYTDFYILECILVARRGCGEYGRGCTCEGCGWMLVGLCVWYNGEEPYKTVEVVLVESDLFLIICVSKLIN